MLTIDGTVGGGQLLRTALSLAAVTETPFRIENLRGGRPNPGLRPQHLAAVELVVDLCDADVTGAELDSETLTFRPGERRRSTLTADVATAGSLTLLFDTVLPVAAACDAPLELTATGGTDVKWAPTVGYHRHVKLPLLADHGLNAALALEKTGFYPVGGGRATLRADPWSPLPFDLMTRGELARVDVYSKAAEVLAEREVADRQANRARECLDADDVPVTVRAVEYVPALCAGSSLLLRAVYEDATTGFDSLGERGRTAEAVAEDAVTQFRACHATGAPVDSHMADQILVFLALAGGRVRIPSETAHVRTSVELLDAFGSDVRVVRDADGTCSLEASVHPVLAAEVRVASAKEYLPSRVNTTRVTSYDHPQRDSPDWDNPDFCPFCGAALVDGGGGFIDHVEHSPPCGERFESWRERIADDIGGEWGG